jgi:hypothetical protein
MKYTKTFTEALREVQRVQEDGHTDVASAVRQCKTAIEDASEILSKLDTMNSEESLPSWWTNKIAIAANSMNKLRDYITVPSVKEDFADINRNKGSKSASSKTDDKKDDVQDLKNQIQLLKVELENEKNKAVKPEPNKNTGEVPLRTGIAQAILDKDTPSPIVNKNKKETIKVGGKSKIQVDPDVDVGQYSDGKKVNGSNLG